MQILFKTMEDKYYPKNVSMKVERNFLIGDRVKTYFKGKWYAGEVVGKYFKKDRGTWNKVPYILVKTDEKVDDDPTAFLKGFGIEDKINNLRNIFEWENEKIMGDTIYHEEITWEKNKEEKREYDKPLPF